MVSDGENAGGDGGEEAPPGVDVQVAPNYHDGCVWVTLPPNPRQCVPPNAARELADEFERAEMDRNDHLGYEVGKLIADLRENADAVEASE